MAKPIDTTENFDPFAVEPLPPSSVPMAPLPPPSNQPILGPQTRGSVEENETEEESQSSGSSSQRSEGHSIDKVALAETLASRGWFHHSTRLSYQYHPVRSESVLYSPYAKLEILTLQRGWDQASYNVKQAFQIFAQRGRPAQIAQSSDSSSAFCGMCLKATTGDHSGRLAFIPMEVKENELSIRFDDILFPGQQEHPAADQAMYIRRFRHRGGATVITKGTEKDGVFIVNQHFESMVVNNGPVVGRGSVVGPLPDFAIVEFDAGVMFWWKNAQALEYAPQPHKSIKAGQPTKAVLKAKQKQPAVRETRSSSKRKRGDDASPAEVLSVSSGSVSRRSSKRRQPPSDIRSTPSRSSKRLKRNDLHAAVVDAPPSSPATGWQAILNEGLARHRQCKARKEERGGSQLPRPLRRLPKSDAMAEDDTLLTIAAFWEGLRQQGRLFAFAGMDFFDKIESKDTGFQLKGTGVVGAPQQFVMPLLLHRRKQKGARTVDQADELGHLVLVVATWLAEQGKVQLNVWDSLPGLSGVTKKEMYDRARELITGSKWPYDQEKNPRQLTFFNSAEHMPCPHQEGNNTCGFFVILNAWCYMLGIPVSPSARRRVRAEEYNFFLEQGLEIMNLALIGCMDAVTVQAFLNVWGYSEVQSSEDDQVTNVDAVTMDTELLNEALYQQAIPEDKGYKPSRDQVMSLMETTGLTGKAKFEVVEAVLSETEGDEHLATIMLLSPSFLASLNKTRSGSHRTSGSSQEVETQRAIAASLQSPSLIGAPTVTEPAQDQGSDDDDSLFGGPLPG